MRAGRGVRRYSFRFPTARVPERQRSACPSRSPGRPAGRQEVASAADTPPSPIADKPTMPSISLIVSISSHRRSYGVQMRTGGSCWSGPDVRRTRVPRAREPVVSRTRCAYTIDVAENYFLKQVVMPLHARAAVQDRDRCTPPHARRDGTRDERRGSNRTAVIQYPRFYRIPRTLGEFAAFSAAFEPSCRWVHSARPRALVPSPAHTHLRSTRKRQASWQPS